VMKPHGHISSGYIFNPRHIVLLIQYYNTPRIYWSISIPVGV